MTDIILFLSNSFNLRVQVSYMNISKQHTRIREFIFRWLLTGAFLVVLMVVIGGITRLTQSGLSMVKWEPIVGALPPLNDTEWNQAFELYKQSPEFHHYNSSFVLSDFKAIYFWEYLHRLIARIIGIVFIIPFIIFYRKKAFTPKLLKQVLIILGLGFLQGLLGWFMVKSGLIDKPHVSHYRLAAHLVTAFILIIYIFWVALNLKYTVSSNTNKKAIRLSWIFLGFAFLQITYGAFVAGLKAGKMYNTFPKMNSEWFPENFTRILHREGISSFLESGGLVQFVHRIIAFIIVIYLFIIWKHFKRSQFTTTQTISFRILVLSVGLQFVIGVLTLITAVPIMLAVMHQVGAILVLLSTIFFIFTLNKTIAGHDNL